MFCTSLEVFKNQAWPTSTEYDNLDSLYNFNTIFRHIYKNIELDQVEVVDWEVYWGK